MVTKRGAPNPQPEHLRIGRRGEEAAAAMLKKRGWKILEANWAAPPLELDLICRDGDTIVFVEVKTRKACAMTRPDEALTPAKQKNLIKAARVWLTKHQAWASPCRFDLVTVTWTEDAGNSGHAAEHYTTELIQHVIELSFDPGNSLGSGHSSWQPW